MNKDLRTLLLVLVIFTVLNGCSGSLVPAGEEGIRVRAGEWSGADESGQFSMQFKMGAGGENIFIHFFSYPCGRQTVSVFPPGPLKARLQDSAFEATTRDLSALLPTLIMTGTFTDSTHVEGTWEFEGEQVTPELGCPPASGAWQGSPK